MEIKPQPKTRVIVAAEGRVPVADFHFEFFRCGHVTRGAELTPDLIQEVKGYLTSRGVIADDHLFRVTTINKVSNRDNAYQAAIRFL